MSDGFKSFLSVPAIPANSFYWFVFITVLIVTGSIRRRLSAFQPNRKAPTHTYIQPSFQDALINLLPRLSLRKESPQVTPEQSNPQSVSSSSESKMRYHRHRRRRSRGKKNKKPVEESEGTESIESTETLLPIHPKQPYDAFLVLDIEGTCKLGTDFNYPNEIIELPVCILEWQDKAPDGRAATLEVVNEFRSFVKPTWQPQLSDFCKELTGISQEQVDDAPTFPAVLVQLEAFLVDNGLIEEGTGKRLKRFCWCSDGPFDIRDFVVKQCFISKVEMPLWVQGDVLDVRSIVLQWMMAQPAQTTPPATPTSGAPPSIAATRRALNIAAQLQVLELPPFEGRQHSGIDDTRNIAKVITELARRGVCLLPNTVIHPGRRWKWMGKPGQVLEEGMT